MSISELRHDITARLVDFTWSQWAQMGVFASSERDDRWAADPEALLLLTFEVGRDDPRLFEEVLDWLSVNERLISIQRLRNMALDESDRALVGAALGWITQRRKRAQPKGGAGPRDSEPEPFFRNLLTGVEDPDPTFLEHGFLKQRAGVERHSGSPDLRAPINFAFRMRSLLGVGARAEVVRILLCTLAPHLSAQAVAASTAYAKRNVQEALASLRGAGAIESSSLGNEQRFQAPRTRWAQLLELDEFPVQVDWPQLFHALRLLLRWLQNAEREELSDYMLASEARTLLEQIVPDLQFAGVPIDTTGPSGPDYWDHFAELVSRLPPA